MKIVIYHISDLHIEKEEDGKVNNVYKMADVLNSIGDFEIVFIIVLILRILKYDKKIKSILS